ncbi:hypothetical protein FRB95_001066 [Tulasnella sp. JGI-2019a]|nr:hypothetical protein FRB95_001066 [Tulasnella sp. JGI-2019a]
MWFPFALFYTYVLARWSLDITFFLLIVALPKVAVSFYHSYTIAITILLQYRICGIWWLWYMLYAFEIPIYFSRLLYRHIRPSPTPPPPRLLYRHIRPSPTPPPPRPQAQPKPSFVVQPLPPLLPSTTDGAARSARRQAKIDPIDALTRRMQDLRISHPYEQYRTRRLHRPTPGLFTAAHDVEPVFIGACKFFFDGSDCKAFIVRDTRGHLRLELSEPDGSRKHRYQMTGNCKCYRQRTEYTFEFSVIVKSSPIGNVTLVEFTVNEMLAGILADGIGMKLPESNRGVTSAYKPWVVQPPTYSPPPPSVLASAPSVLSPPPSLTTSPDNKTTSCTMSSATITQAALPINTDTREVKVATEELVEVVIDGAETLDRQKDVVLVVDEVASCPTTDNGTAAEVVANCASLEPHNVALPEDATDDWIPDVVPPPQPSDIDTTFARASHPAIPPFIFGEKTNGNGDRPTRSLPRRAKPLCPFPVKFSGLQRAMRGGSAVFGFTSSTPASMLRQSIGPVAAQGQRDEPEGSSTRHRFLSDTFQGNVGMSSNDEKADTAHEALAPPLSAHTQQ